MKHSGDALIVSSKDVPPVLLGTALGLSNQDDLGPLRREPLNFGDKSSRVVRLSSPQMADENGCRSIVLKHAHRVKRDAPVRFERRQLRQEVRVYSQRERLNLVSIPECYSWGECDFEDGSYSYHLLLEDCSTAQSRQFGLDDSWGVPSIYSIVPPNDGSALRHGHHFEPVDFVIDHGRGRHDAYSAGSCQRSYARACGCRQRARRHREELIESERGWSGREAFVTMMQTADLGQGNDRSGPGRLNGSTIRCVLADRQVGP